MVKKSGADWQLPTRAFHRHRFCSQWVHANKIMIPYRLNECVCILSEFIVSYVGFLLQGWMWLFRLERNRYPAGQNFCRTPLTCRSCAAKRDIYNLPQSDHLPHHNFDEIYIYNLPQKQPLAATFWLITGCDDWTDWIHVCKVNYANIHVATTKHCSPNIDLALMFPTRPSIYIILAAATCRIFWLFFATYI